MSRFAAQEIAAASEWNGDPDFWLAALGETGWIDATGHLHDWTNHGGKVVRERQAAEERMRRHRERATGKEVAGESPPIESCSANVRVMFGERSVLDKRRGDKNKAHTQTGVGAGGGAGARRTGDCGESETAKAAGAGAFFPGLPECLALAAAHAVPAGCAEKWWREQDARGGLDRHGQPLRRWESSLLAYAAGWCEREERSRGVQGVNGGAGARPSGNQGTLDDGVVGRFGNGDHIIQA
ncbi:MAG: hypothetical protein JNK85_12765 [Verrucomicrobiales bacterium]|nr:hypothetical protein [Verrucomicrobiales bacterium]